ncbi:hypothetical protein DBU35_004751, partial [Escherichia coli O20]|nr:hypothetical protein [Escherichia coli O20]
MIGSMPNHDRFECQTMIDSDAILQNASFIFGGGPNATVSFINNGTVNKGLSVYSHLDSRLINNGNMTAHVTQIAAEGNGRGIITVENH